MNKITLAWAEDNVGFISSIRNFIKDEAGHLMDFLFIVENGHKMVNMLETHQPDIVLIDIGMPEMDGIVATQIIKKKYPCLKIIALTEFDSEFNIVEMNKAGVKSFVTKRQADQLVRIIKIVSEGGVYLPDEVAEVLQRYLHKTTLASKMVSKVQLKEFELKLLQAICEGKSSFKIGYEFSLSQRTIEEHREKLYQKFVVKNKEELIVRAIQQAIVHIP